MRGSEHDRAIARLALPALGALLAEPAYVLADTAVVGHIGTTQLAGLAVASSALLTGYTVCIFLAYGTTAAVARLLGAGHRREAAHQAVQGLWLAGALSVPIVAASVLWTTPLLRLLGADGAVLQEATVYFRISLAGVPALVLTLAGTGYLRGLQDTRTPLVVAATTAVANLAIELVLINGLGYGIGASALSTVLVQTAGALVYVRLIARSAVSLGADLRPAPREMGALLRVGGNLLVRTVALRAAFGLSTAIAARIGTVDLGAHQVAWELLGFLALGLDALAIAGQSMIGHELGAGRAQLARAIGDRLLQLGVVGGVAAGLLIVATRPWLPHVFTDDPEVVRLAGFLLLWVAALQPLDGLIFALDGLLIGAGDLRYLAVAMAGGLAVFAPLALAVALTDAGIGWLWAALTTFMATRAIALGHRWRSGRWAVTGAAA